MFKKIICMTLAVLTFFSVSQTFSVLAAVRNIELNTTCEEITRKASSGDESGDETVVDVNVLQAKSVFSAAPANIDEFKQLHRADPLLPNQKDAAIKSDNAKGRFEVAALYFAALKAYDPKNPAEYEKMMEELTDSPTTRALGYDTFKSDSGYLKENYKYKYYGNAFFDGAEPDNGYTPSEPLTVTLEDYVYSSQSSTDYQTQIYKIVTRFKGADSERIVDVYQDSLDGKWYLFSDSWGNLTSKIKSPALQYIAQWQAEEAAETPVNDSDKKLLYFNTSEWKTDKEVYCHIWERGADSFYTWQSKKEKCQKVDNAHWTYDITDLDFNSEKDYCLIIFTGFGNQSCDITFAPECAGDTLTVVNNKIENPVDPPKAANEALWSKNGGKYGPHLALTSSGNIVGSKLCPNESGIEIIGDWLPTYYLSTNIMDIVSTLAKAYPKFGITKASQIQDIYVYIHNKKTGEDEAAMKKMLEDAFAKAYPAYNTDSKKSIQPKTVNKKVKTTSTSKKSNPIKVKAINKTFKAKALKKKAKSYTALKVTKAKGKLTYKVKKKSKKLTFKKGKITVKKKTKKGTYKLTVTVTAAGNKTYKKGAKTVTVKVKVK